MKQISELGRRQVRIHKFPILLSKYLSYILLARFPKDRQEDECTLLLGTYVELVDREVVLKEKELLVDTLIGVLRTKTESARNRAVPQVHIALT